jgi:hypothetical protein
MQAGLQTATSRGVHTAQARIPEPSKILAGSTAGVLGSTLPYRVTPRQYGPHWLDHFLLLAAVQLQGEAKVTAMAPLYTQVSQSGDMALWLSCNAALAACAWGVALKLRLWQLL